MERVSTGLYLARTGRNELAVETLTVADRWVGAGCRAHAELEDLLGQCDEGMSPMAIRNYLIEGGSGTGKTSVGRELQRRGYHVVHGDTELAYQGDPVTGEPLGGLSHEHHIWNVDELDTLMVDRRRATSFFCGGSRNFSRFIDRFDRVFVLQIDSGTLTRRLANRPRNEWGGRPAEKRLIKRLHATQEDVPVCGARIDATMAIGRVADEILARCR